MASATVSEQQQQMFGFPFNKISKRKLEQEDASKSLVQENGTLVPRCEKRQRFNLDANKDENFELEGYNMSENETKLDQTCKFEDEAEMDVEPEAIMESANTSCAPEKCEGNITEPNFSTPNYYQRPRGINCTAPVVHSYCFENALLDNLIMNYHGA